MRCLPAQTPRALLLASVFTMALGAAAHAADVTEAQAKDVADRLRAWIAGLVTDRVPLSPTLLDVQPAGLNYRLTFPLPPGVLQTKDEPGQPPGGAVIILAHPEEGTRWRIDGYTFPAHFTLGPAAAAAMAGMTPPPLAALPPGTPGSPPASPAPPGAPTAEWHIKSQSASGVYDTAQATESYLNYALEGYRSDVKNLGGQGTSTTTIDRYHGTSRLKPTQSGGTDLTGDFTVEGYQQSTDLPQIGQMRIAAKRMLVRGDIRSVMTGQLAALIRLGVDTGLDAQAAKAAGDKAADTPAVKPDVTREVFKLLRGLLAGMRVDETVEGLELDLPQGRGSASTAQFGFGGDAPGDKFQGYMEFGVTGLKVLGLPPQFADLLPSRLVFRPTVANIDLKGLTALAEAANRPGSDEATTKARMAAIFTSNGVRLGVERFEADLGFASLSASGSATMLNQNAARGQAEVVITGLDAVMQRAQTLPNPAQMIAFLAMAKGFGKAEGNRTVWNITFSEDNKVIVNGMDISKMGAK